MAEEILENQLPEKDDLTEQAEPQDAGKEEKPQKVKNHRMTKEEKEAAREAAKNKSRAQKEWEDSLVANKRVKREEMKRKLKRAMIILLAFSLILTSIVYIMLLFIEENNIRITASSSSDKSITLSFDKIHWTPYLDVDGPDNMWHVSYNPVYDLEKIPTKADVLQTFEKIEGGEVIGGNFSQANVIEFCFYLRNNSEVPVPYNFDIALESNNLGLEDCMRVLWGTHIIGTNPDRVDRPQTAINCYASLSQDSRLAYNMIGADGILYESGGVEKIAYPMNADFFTEEQLQKYEEGLEFDQIKMEYVPVNLNDKEGNLMYDSVDDYLTATGYANTVPFHSEDYVLKGESYLDVGEVLCVYVCIWIEGSDFDCKDSALGGYISLSVNFETH